MTKQHRRWQHNTLWGVPFSNIRANLVTLVMFCDFVDTEITHSCSHYADNNYVKTTLSILSINMLINAIQWRTDWLYLELHNIWQFFNRIWVRAPYIQHTHPMANVDTVVPTKANVTIAPKFLKNCFCTKKKQKNTVQFLLHIYLCTYQIKSQATANHNWQTAGQTIITQTYCSSVQFAQHQINSLWWPRLL